MDIEKYKEIKKLKNGYQLHTILKILSIWIGFTVKQIRYNKLRKFALAERMSFHL
jgi:hypothetical protein